ncbi:MAG: molybdenum cofactor guanylyltransferase [Methanobacterium sp.]|nr:molybdenum cofactor guanylyltransferase [Methanobacterium sp.]
MKSVIVLCGGLSTRMGQDKGSMDYHDKPMVVHVLESLEQVADEVMLVIRNEDQYSKYKNLLLKHAILESSNFKILKDTVKDKGPLGGIYTGISAIHSDKALIVPCDSPFISKELVTQIFEISKNFPDFESYVPIWPDGNMEPLHSIYPANSKEIIDDLLLNDQRNVKALIERLNVKFIEIEEFNLPKESFLNLNSPKDISKLDQGK